MNRTTKFSRFINAMMIICIVLFSLLITSCGDDHEELKPTLDEIDIFATLEKDEMVFVKGGTFLMGAQSADASAPNFDYQADGDESPVHSVTLSDYYIGKYEVTQQLWEYVMKYSGKAADGSTMSAYATDVWMGSNPSTSYGAGNYYPAYYVSWDDIVNIFIKRCLFANKSTLATTYFKLNGVVVME